MKIFIERDNKRVRMKFAGRASDLLKKIKINKETVLIIKNNELVDYDEMLSDNDDIKILSVVSGG